MKLTEILDSDDIDLILYDTCVENSHDFSWDIYGSVNYSDLNVNSLKKEIEVIGQAKEILRNPKIKTISAITKELKGFEKIINRKIEYFSSHNIPKKGNRRIFRRVC